MTLSSATIKDTFNGDGSTKEFDTSWVFWNSSEVAVILVSSSGSETTWTEGTEYSVTGGDGAVGTVSVSTGPTSYVPASGKELILKSNVRNVQETALPAGGSFPSTSVEQELDRTVRRIQQEAGENDRSVKLLDSSTYANITIPDPSAGSILQWNSGETGFENATIVGSSAITVPVAVISGGTGGTTAEAARTNLDVVENVLTTQGDIIQAGSTGGPEVVSKGADNTILTANSTDVGWETGTAWFDDAFGSSAGQVLVRSSTGAWTALTAGSSGTVLVSQGPGATPTWGSNGSLGTLFDATSPGSETSADWTGIPSDAKMIIVSMTAISSTGTSKFIVQIGDSGGIETSGYVGASIATGTAVTDWGGSGIEMTATTAAAAASNYNGAILLTKMDTSANSWTAFGIISRNTSADIMYTSGTKSLSGTLDRVRLTTLGGTDTFDAGTANITYMG